MEAEFVSNLLHFTHRSNETPYCNSTQDYRGFLVPHLCSGGGGAGVSRIVLIWQYVAYAFETLALF